MIAQLHRYFEDVVLENNLSALVIERLPFVSARSSREINRIKELVSTAHSFFLIADPNDSLTTLSLSPPKGANQPIVLKRSTEDTIYERFAIIADARFSALLASVHSEDEDDSGDMVIWTFEPDVVYSGLEYLMARVTAEYPVYARSFAEAVRLSMPKATSLQLTLGVTTKLARLLQEQAECELAVNHIATTIRNSLDLDVVLSTAATEVGRALNVDCVVRVEGELVGREVTKHHFRQAKDNEESIRADLMERVKTLAAEMSGQTKGSVVDGDGGSAHALVPLLRNEGRVGFLLVLSDDPGCIWAENELLLLHTVADQLTVAVYQAHLYAQMEELALTDALTGCHNRRSFELQLERDLHLATRMRQPLSLIMIDLDYFKRINDAAGHEAGDTALRQVAQSLRSELRAVDTAARFGGDEFAIILPQANIEGAQLAAERLRRCIRQTELPGFGAMSASFGVATFPFHASARDALVNAADKALYLAKESGRDRVSVPPQSLTVSDEH